MPAAAAATRSWVSLRIPRSMMGDDGNATGRADATRQLRYRVGDAVAPTDYAPAARVRPVARQLRGRAGAHPAARRGEVRSGDAPAAARGRDAGRDVQLPQRLVLPREAGVCDDVRAPTAEKRRRARHHDAPRAASAG